MKMLQLMLGRLVSLVCVTIVLGGEQVPLAKQPGLLQQSNTRSGVDAPLPDSSHPEGDSIDEDSDRDLPESGLQTEWYSQDYPPEVTDPTSSSGTPKPPPPPPPPPVVTPPAMNPISPEPPKAPTPVSSEASKMKEELKEEVDKGAASARAMKSGVDTLKADAESMGRVQSELDAESGKLTSSLKEALELAKKCEAELNAKKSELAEKKRARDTAREKAESARRSHDGLEEDLAKVNQEIAQLESEVSALKSDLASAQERYTTLATEEADLTKELEEIKRDSKKQQKDLQEQLDDATHTLEGARSDATRLQKQYDDASSQADKLRAEIAHLEDNLKAAKKAADTLKVYAEEAAMMGGAGDDDVPSPPSS